MMNTGDLVFSMSLAWAAFGMAIPTVVKIAPPLPTGAYFEVREIRAERRGNSAVLFVDREIRAPLHMSFNVRIMEQVGEGWRQFCGTGVQGPLWYMPDAVIDQPVTLEWWTFGRCSELPDRAARIVTTWNPMGEALQPLTVVVEVPAAEGGEG